jgi:glycosyltransferase involved in cell wall biosynthesis
MAAGRANVAPDQENLREVLTHGRDALLFDPGQPAALAAAVARLAREPALRHALGAAARETVVREKLTWDGAAGRVEAVAGTCLAERRAVVSRGRPGRAPRRTGA